MRLTILTLYLLVSACGTAKVAPDSVASKRPVQKCASGLNGEQELKLSMAKDHIAAGRLYAGLATLEALPSSSPEVLRQKADISRRIVKDDAKSLYEDLRRTCLSGYGSHGLGLLAAQRGEYIEAEGWLERAAIQLPTEANIRNDLGLAYIFTGKPDAARFELMTAVELEPSYEKPIINLAALFLLNSDHKSLDGLAERFKFGSEQVSSAMKTCQQVKDIQEADKPLDQGQDTQSCSWQTVGRSSRLAVLFKSN